MTQRHGWWTASGFRRPLCAVLALNVVAVTPALTGCSTAAVGHPLFLKGQQHKSLVPAALPVPKPASPEHIVVIGDSLSTGFGTSPEEAWPWLLGEDLRSAQVPAEVTNAARNGAGYVSAGDDESTFQSQISASVNTSTDMVVLFGSDNDAGQDPSELHAALTDALHEIKSAAPHAKRVVIGPLTAFDALEADVDAIRDEERAVASDAGIKFVDPVAEHWVPEPDSVLLGPDGEHPSSEGQKFLEGKIKALVTEPQNRGL